MTTLDDLIARAEALATEQQTLVRDLKAYKRAQKPRAAEQQLKGSDGKLTEYGVRMLHAGFAANKTPSELARMFDITIPAVLYRHSTWFAERKGRR
jgi:hypothetical protein